MAKVLIIEDEQLIAQMYEKSLEKGGLEAIIGLGGKEGIEVAKKEKPDLILLDLMMPEPDGMQVLSSLKLDPETKLIPVIVLTNVTGENDRELAMKKGASGFWFKKDVDPVTLPSRVREILSKVEKK